MLLPHGEIATGMCCGPKKGQTVAGSLPVELILADPANKLVLCIASREAKVAATKLLSQYSEQFDVENEVLNHLHFYKHIKEMPEKRKAAECLYLVQIRS